MRCSRRRTTTPARGADARGARFGLAWLDLAGGRFSVIGARRRRRAACGARAAAAGRAAARRGRRSARLARRVPGAAPPAHRGISIRAAPQRAAVRAVRHARSRAASAPTTRRSRSAPRGACCSTRATRRSGACRTCARCTASCASDAVLMDAATRRNLEIDSSLPDRADETRSRACSTARATAMGGRALRRWLAAAAARPRRSSQRGCRRSSCSQSSGPLDDTRFVLQGDRRRRAHPRARRAALGAAARPRRSCATRSTRLPDCRRRFASSTRRVHRRRWPRSAGDARRRRSDLLAARDRRGAAGAAARRRRDRAGLRRGARRAARASATHADEYLDARAARARAHRLREPAKSATTACTATTSR